MISRQVVLFWHQCQCVSKDLLITSRDSQQKLQNHVLHEPDARDSLLLYLILTPEQAEIAPSTHFSLVILCLHETVILTQHFFYILVLGRSAFWMRASCSLLLWQPCCLLRSVWEHLKLDRHANWKAVLIKQSASFVLLALQVTSITHVKLKCPLHLCSSPS